MKRLIWAIMLLIAADAFAQNSGDITVVSIWARATPPGAKSGAVYMTLRNRGAADDKLIGATTPVAAKAGLHTEIMDNSVMKMRPLESVDIAPGGSASLKPGGSHIMLMGLKRPLKQGDHIPLTLRFAHAPPLTVQVEVAKIGASGPDAGGRADTMKDMQ
jgi:periplasmic copper chaperone A